MRISREREKCQKTHLPRDLAALALGCFLLHKNDLSLLPCATHDPFGPRGLQQSRVSWTYCLRCHCCRLLRKEVESCVWVVALGLLVLATFFLFVMVNREYGGGAWWVGKLGWKLGLCGVSIIRLRGSLLRGGSSFSITKPPVYSHSSFSHSVLTMS